MPKHDGPPFGQLAAENEDTFLEEVYLSDLFDKRHQSALALHHRIILGLRGTGKTALARFLRFQKEQPFDVYVSIDQRTALSRILTDVEELMSRGRAPFSEDIVRLWILALWTALMSELHESNRLRTPAVERYLSYAQPKGPLGRAQILLDGLAARLRTEGITLLDWDGLQKLLDESQFSAAQQDTRRCLGRSIPRSVIVIDSLEDLPLDTAAMTSVATALLTAVNRPNQEIYQLPTSVYIKCLVPTELWRAVRAQMSGYGKFAPFEMRWTEDDLLRLICLRYTNHLAERLGKNAPVLPSAIQWTSAKDVRSKAWGRFFPAHAQGGSGMMEDVETLLMRHTQLRPRQLIFLCNDIASRSHTTRFQPNHVRDAIRNTVDDLAVATFAANRVIHPNAESVLRQHLQGRPAIFQSDDLDVDDKFWQLGYELGVLGPVMSSSSRPFDEAEFLGYRKTGFIFCGTAPANWVPKGEEVAVHPIFHRRFGIKETADTMVGLDHPQS